jgi:hypothetical protein
MKPGLRIFALVWLALAILARVHGLGLRSDSYEHFASSVKVIATLDWRALLVNLWNKPLPTLLYGVSGQLGLFAARLVSVSLTVATAVCVWDATRKLWPSSARIHPSWVAVAFVFQLAVLPESFVTMTELPAAFALSLGLCLHLRGRTSAACVVWGLMPLLRVETALLTGMLVAVIGALTLTRARDSRTTWPLVARWAGLAAVPMLAWWAAGVFAAGDVHWFSKGAYAHLRAWSLPAVVTVNGVNGLGGVLSGPMLCFGLVGAVRLRSIVDPARRDVAALLLGCIAVHVAFLTMALVYPAETLGGLGVAAINARNFNVIAPLLALAVIAGVEDWSQWIERRLTGSSVIYLGAAVLAVAIVIGFWFMQTAWGASGVGTAYRLLAGLALIGLLAAGSLASRAVRSITARRAAAMTYGFLTFATLVSVPTFWYPLTSQDARAAAGRDFCAWYSTRQDHPTRVIQDFIGSLDQFCGMTNVNADWTWPTDFTHAIHESPTAWIIVTVDATGEPPAAIYPRELLALLPTYRLLASRPAAPISEWQRRLNLIEWQNHPVGWRVYCLPG